MTLNSVALIADDSVAIRLLLEAMLKELNVRTIYHCEDGKQALNKLRQYSQEIEVMFLDLHMPGLDGVQLIEKIAQLDFSGAIIFMSSMEERVLESAKRLGIENKLNIAGTLNKPFTALEVSEALKMARNFSPIIEHALEPLTADEVHEAMTNNYFMPYFQPIVNTQDNSIFALEMLARLDIPGKGTILPAQFFGIDISQETVFEFNGRLYDIAFEQFAKLKAIAPAIKLSLNVEIDMLKHHDFVTWLSFYVNKYPAIEPEDIMLEIDEKQAFIGNNLVEQNLTRLKINNYNLCIDGFGSGLANLDTLATLPFNIAKIDRFFIQGICSSGITPEFVKSLKTLTQGLKITTIFEGVEVPEDLRFVEQLEFELFQGYLLCRPKPFEVIQRWMKSYLERHKLPM